MAITKQTARNPNIVPRSQAHNVGVLGLQRLTSMNPAAGTSEGRNQDQPDDAATTAPGITANKDHSSSLTKSVALRNAEQYLDSIEDKLAQFEGVKDAILSSVEALYDIKRMSPDDNAENIAKLKRTISIGLRRNTTLLEKFNDFMPQFAAFEVLNADGSEAVKRSDSKMVSQGQPRTGMDVAEARKRLANAAAFDSLSRDVALRSANRYLTSLRDNQAITPYMGGRALKALRQLYDLNRSAPPESRQRVVDLKNFISGCLQHNPGLMKHFNDFMPEFAPFEDQDFKFAESERGKNSNSRKVPPEAPRRAKQMSQKEMNRLEKKKKAEAGERPWAYAHNKHHTVLIKKTTMKRLAEHLDSIKGSLPSPEAGEQISHAIGGLYDAQMATKGWREAPDEEFVQGVKTTISELLGGDIDLIKHFNKFLPGYAQFKDLTGSSSNKESDSSPGEESDPSPSEDSAEESDSSPSEESDPSPSEDSLQEEETLANLGKRTAKSKSKPASESKSQPTAKPDLIKKTVMAELAEHLELIKDSLQTPEDGGLISHAIGGLYDAQAITEEFSEAPDKEFVEEVQARISESLGGNIDLIKPFNRFLPGYAQFKDLLPHEAPTADSNSNAKSKSQPSTKPTADSESKSKPQPSKSDSNAKSKSQPSTEPTADSNSNAKSKSQPSTKPTAESKSKSKPQPSKSD